MVIAVAGMAAAVAIALPALALAGKPVIHEHFSFTTDPYPTSICGIDVTGVDTVVGQ
jgi:hypothetical protein